ncbi:two-component system sensor histidine kinase NtrB [Stakelama marina]|uniref:histidine kinase n=1 Tax=Stakelama marina TaxID=2826939 RepID=A0A8T4IAA8_9SPHN|nr:ATP-binding protein [Stakelama marina]MBR0551597.1 PAS domain-containing protein [Stakelama marina]
MADIGPGETLRRPGHAELIAALPVAALVLDRAGRIVLANTACEHLVNRSERSMLGKPLESVLKPPAGYGDRREELGFAAYDAEIALTRGGTLRADFIETAMSDQFAFRVVTLHNKAPGHRIDRTAGARAAIGAAAMLAHEIKNPLSGIRGAAQLLQSGVDDGDAMTSLIITEVDRIAALIDRMEDFTDTRPLALQATNIYTSLGHARQVAEAGFARGIAIEEEFDPSLPPVLVDRDALLQILVNLLKNASEAAATADEPRLRIATAYRHGMSISVGPGHPRRPLPIEVAIMDNGPGAPEDIAEHLFEPFVSGKPEGKGLGLPLVDKLVREMGGRVQYAREGFAEKMTVFRLFLPRADG